jgi:hypothetical protein
MPKAKKKTVKRTVTCGKCKTTGHNARTCPTSTKKKKITSSADIPPPPVAGIKTKIDLRQEQTEKRMNTVPKRSAPTAGNTSENNHAPYRCEKCTQVAILVSIRVKDHNASYKAGKDVYMADLRCEKCFNKPPAELILKWGCHPGEVVPVPANA